MYSENPKPRSIILDDATATDLILIKRCSQLRPTYELRLATFMARENNRRLRIILTAGASAHPTLLAFARQWGVIIDQEL